MPTALFISPHLDDVAFSCGGILIALVQQGWRVELCTVFTASVPNPQGFALRCQTDKGIAPDVDYMALRRAEDQCFAECAGVALLHHWFFAEAPHRGYDAPAALFAGVRDDDDIGHALVAPLQTLTAACQPTLIFGPQGLGNHVDHLHVIAALRQAAAATPVCWYRDTPYAIRQPAAQPAPLLPDDVHPFAVGIDTTLAAKIAGCRAYASQLGFQFGGADNVGPTLRTFHQHEAERHSLDGFAEVLSSASEPSEPVVDMLRQIKT